MDLVDTAVEFFQIAPPANIVPDFSVASALRTDNLLDLTAFPRRNALQLLCVKVAFYRLTHLIAQFVGRRWVRQVTVHHEQLASPFRNVAFLEGRAVRQSHADVVTQFEVPPTLPRAFLQVDLFSYEIFIVCVHFVRRHADRSVVRRVVESTSFCTTST